MVVQQILRGELSFLRAFISFLFQNHEESGSFWVDSVNTLLEYNATKLTKVGEAYNKPYHLDTFRPRHQG